MNNEHKGEVTFDVAGESYVMRRSWNSICELEGLTGRGFYTLSMELASWGPPVERGKPKKESAAEVNARMDRIRGSTLRAVFCAMLRDERPGMTLREAGDLMDALGTEKVIEFVMLAFERGNPAETKGARPPQETALNGKTAHSATSEST